HAVGHAALCIATLAALAATTASAPGARAENAPPQDAIRIDVVEPATRTTAVSPLPASVGIVFTQGEFPAGATGALRDDQGLPIPFESDITGYWDATKSHVKWLLLHFRADPARTYYFDPAGGAGSALRPEGKPLATAADGAIAINAGRLTAR